MVVRSSAEEFLFVRAVSLNFGLHGISVCRRFVMTGRYDFPFFEGRKVKKTLDFIGDGAR